MATRIFCDICKMESESPYVVEITGSDDIDLCFRCRNELLQMIEYFKRQGRIYK